MSKLTWYYNRLRAMSPGEILYRVGQRVQMEKERLNLMQPAGGYSDEVLWRGLGQPEVLDWDRWVQSFRQYVSLPSLIGREDAGEFLRRYPDEADRLIQSADRILLGEVCFFGHLPVKLSLPPDWHLDPITGQRWPQVFYGDVDFRWGGAKTIWEAARHQFLITLGQAYFLTGRSEYLWGLKSYLESWLTQNPPYVGIHWTSGLETAIRLVSWAWTYTLTSGAFLDAELGREWTRSIVAHGHYLSHHLSRYSSANNHLIGESMGLLMASVLVPEWRESPIWEAKARRILEEQALEQLLTDGSPAEQAMHYLGFILDFYLLFALGSQSCGFSLKEKTIARMVASGKFIVGLMDAEGNLPAIGDEDGGHAFVIASDKVHLMRSRLATLTVVCNHPEFKIAAGQLDPRSWWLVGENGAKKFDSLPLQEGAGGIFSFPNGGYWVLRTDKAHGEHRLIFDCGSLGYLSLAAHGHADCLSVWLSLGGEPVLVDSGTYKYHEELEWRSYFRGTAAHNTVRVDGVDQSQQTGPTIWGRKAQPKLLLFSEDRDFTWVEAQHNGYEVLNPPVIHRRGIGLVRSSYYIIVDWLEGSGNHLVETLFHFPPRAKVQFQDNSCSVIYNGKRISIISAGNGDQSAEIVTGQENPIQGWHSSRFWYKEPAPTLVYTLNKPCPFGQLTILWPLMNTKPAVQVFEYKSSRTAVHFVVQNGECRDEFFLDVAPPSEQTLLGGRLCTNRIGCAHLVGGNLSAFCSLE